MNSGKETEFVSLLEALGSEDLPHMKGMGRRERKQRIGTLEQIMVTPIRPAEFILGKTLPFFLIGLLDVSLIAIVGTLWFQIPFRGQIVVLFTGRFFSCCACWESAC